MDQKKIKGEIKKFLKTNESGNTTYQNLWEAEKGIIRGKFLAISTCIKKQERSQVNNPILCLKKWKEK